MIHFFIPYGLFQLMFFVMVCATGGFGGLGLNILNPKVLIREGMNKPCGWIFGTLFNLALIPYAIIYWCAKLHRKSQR